MITFLCLIGVLIIPILVFVVAKATENYTDEHDIVKSISLLLIGVMVIAILVVGLCVPICRATDKVNIAYMQQEYVIIENRLRSDPEIWDAALTKEVIEYNGRVIRGRYWKNNPWTNVFWSNEWNNLKLIEIPNG